MPRRFADGSALGSSRQVAANKTRKILGKPKPGKRATHLLLYLNRHTFVADGGKLRPSTLGRHHTLTWRDGTQRPSTRPTELASDAPWQARWARR